MRYMLRTDVYEFEVSRTAVPKTDQNGVQKVDGRTRQPVWEVQLTAWQGEEQGSDVLTVQVAAPSAPALRWREPVVVEDLEAIPWAQKRRDGDLYQGVSLKAASIRPASGGLSAVAS